MSELTISEALNRITAVLQEASTNLVAAQHVVSVCVNNPHVSEQDMQAAQSLDAATQTVQAVCTILQTLSKQDALATAGHVEPQTLYPSAALGHISAVLQTGSAAKLAVSDDVEFF